MEKVTPLDVNKVERIDPLSKRETSGSSKLGKDEFLKLLLTQLANQDPTSPADSQAFVAQLAQFSSLELAQNTNSHLEALLMGQSRQQQTSLASLVGKEVAFRTDQVTLRDGKPVTALARLEAPAANVTVAVSDAQGRTVRTLHLGERAAGTFDVTWDGREEGGAAAAPGTYSLRVTAADESGKSVSIDQRGRSRVTGVSLEKNPPELLLGDDRIKLSDVIEINERSTQ